MPRSTTRRTARMTSPRIRMARMKTMEVALQPSPRQRPRTRLSPLRSSAFCLQRPSCFLYTSGPHTSWTALSMQCVNRSDTYDAASTQFIGFACNAWGKTCAQKIMYSESAAQICAHSFQQPGFKPLARQESKQATSFVG